MQPDADNNTVPSRHPSGMNLRSSSQCARGFFTVSGKISVADSAWLAGLAGQVRGKAQEPGVRSQGVPEYLDTTGQSCVTSWFLV
jgi:hypothetical protein